MDLQFRYTGKLLRIALIDSENTYFIMQEAPYNDEHPVIMYFRHTYDAACETADTFTAGDTKYMVYQLRAKK